MTKIEQTSDMIESVVRQEITMWPPSNVAPDRATYGDIWKNKTEHKYYRYDGENWVAADFDEAQGDKMYATCSVY
mgnify:CR=1 FL=1